jgi:hypothetical protein
MKIITIEDVYKEVEKIKRLAGDPESAHDHEDGLHQAVLQLIADGKCQNPPLFAAAALRTKNIDFQRWCA